MLFAPTLADRAILPTAWRGRYFFNRIGRFLPVQTGEIHTHERRHTQLHSTFPTPHPFLPNLYPLTAS
ncbi:hypothetical protein AO985_31535 [Pseudomonas aeruginosa]|nr:hypothetical protein AO985_31535 [Pseudomonas aeruginosa]